MANHSTNYKLHFNRSVILQKYLFTFSSIIFWGSGFGSAPFLGLGPGLDSISPHCAKRVAMTNKLAISVSCIDDDKSQFGKNILSELLGISWKKASSNNNCLTREELEWFAGGKTATLLYLGWEFVRGKMSPPPWQNKRPSPVLFRRCWHHQFSLGLLGNSTLIMLLLTHFFYSIIIWFLWYIIFLLLLFLKSVHFKLLLCTGCIYSYRVKSLLGLWIFYAPRSSNQGALFIRAVHLR